MAMLLQLHDKQIPTAGICIESSRLHAECGGRFKTKHRTESAVRVSNQSIVETHNHDCNRHGFSDHPKPSFALLQCLLRLLEVGDVGVCRDRASIIGFAFVDLDPATVSAVLLMSTHGIPVLR